MSDEIRITCDGCDCDCDLGGLRALAVELETKVGAGESDDKPRGFASIFKFGLTIFEFLKDLPIDFGDVKEILAQVRVLYDKIKDKSITLDDVVAFAKYLIGLFTDSDEDADILIGKLKE